MAKQDTCKKPENGEIIVEDVEQKMNGHTWLKFCITVDNTTVFNVYQ